MRGIEITTTPESVFSLDDVLGRYVPVTDPISGSIAPGLAGVDFTYIGRLLFLLIVVSVFCTMLIKFIGRWK